MTSQEVVDFVKSRLDQMKPAKICEEVRLICTHVAYQTSNNFLLLI